MAGERRGIPGKLHYTRVLEFSCLSPSYPNVTLPNWSSTDRHQMVDDVTRLSVGVEWTATRRHKTPIHIINSLTPNDHYSGRTATLTSKRCILYIYSTNIGIEYFKHGIYSPFFSSSKCSLFHNSSVFGSCIIHILYTECAKI